MGLTAPHVALSAIGTSRRIARLIQHNANRRIYCDILCPLMDTRERDADSAW